MVNRSNPFVDPKYNKLDPEDLIGVLGPNPNPVRRPPIRKKDAIACAAVAAGRATADEQITAWNWLIFCACETYGNPARSQENMTNIAIGKMTAGQNMVWATKLSGGMAMDMDKRSIREHFDKIDSQTEDKPEQ